MGLTTGQRLLIAISCFGVAIVGFMLKLPSAFRGMDKELHATFYFLAAAFLNMLFARRKLVRHAAIFITLFLFGVAIEHVQAYSNRFFRRRIHGRFDPEDIEWNVKGLLAFSALWLVWAIVVLVSKKAGESNRSK